MGATKELKAPKPQKADKKREKAAEPTAFLVSWWIWLGDTYRFAAKIAAEPIHFSQTPSITWGLAENPYWTTPDRRWMLAEWGTGYVLAYGPDRASCLAAARRAFSENKREKRIGWRAIDITQLITAHLNMLQRHMGKTAGFVLPKRERTPRFRLPDDSLQLGSFEPFLI